MTALYQEIPLSNLIASRANVRRTDRKSGVAALAASIVAHGLLQNLTVRPTAQPDQYEVLAGGRRLAALRLLAKHGKLATDAPIPCKVSREGTATEISLAENLTQCPMHPADQYEAFAALQKKHGMGARDIAARFGVPVAIVRQRLKLGAVSPVLMAAYRADEMSLDQLSAFTITDDYARQQAVWEALPPWDASRSSILHALGEGQITGRDRRAKFIGVKAYQAAGGMITRDLFDVGNSFFDDPALLDQLVREKLEKVAATVSKEGWQWVEIMPELDYEYFSSMRRAYPEPVELTEDEQQRLDALEGEYTELSERCGEDTSPEEAARLEVLEAEIDALSNREVFAPETRGVAGAIVSLRSDGDVRIERGLIGVEKGAKAEDQAEGDPDGPDETSPSLNEHIGLSDALVAELTSYRTAALRNKLAGDHSLALAVAVHAVAAPLFFAHEEPPTCLRVTAREVQLAQRVPSIADNRAMREIGARHAAWVKRIPETVEGLWPMVLALSEADRLALLAHCLSFAIDAVQPSGNRRGVNLEHADVLAAQLGLDMSSYWEATATSYFSRVPKPLILAAVTEGVSPQAAENLSKLKKQPMAEMAEQRLAGKGWLPAILRTVPLTDADAVVLQEAAE